MRVGKNRQGRNAAGGTNGGNGEGEQGVFRLHQIISLFV
jgi:hypothetical protein